MNIGATFYKAAAYLNPARWFSGRPKALPAPFERKSGGDVPDDPAWTFTFSTGAEPADSLIASHWVYACAKEIATLAATIPLKVYRRGTNGYAPVKDDDLLAKLIARPAKGWTYARWMEANAYHLTLTGRTYLEKYRTRAYGKSAIYNKGIPTELFPFHAGEFKTSVDKDDRRSPVKSYKPKRGNKAEVSPEDMISVAYIRPGKPGEAFAPVEAGQGEIATDARAAAWQRHSLANDAVPAGIFKARDHMSDPQHDELEAHIGKKWAGMKNARRPMLISGDVDWIALARNAVEMDLIAGRNATKGGICAVMGVPSVIFDQAAQTYANLSTANVMLATHTVLPLVNRIVDQLNIELAPEFGDDYWIGVDLEAVDALLPLLLERWTVAKIAREFGVPVSQLAETFRLNIKPFPGWEVGLTAAGQVSIEEFTAGGSLADDGGVA